VISVWENTAYVEAKVLRVNSEKLLRGIRRTLDTMELINRVARNAKLFVNKVEAVLIYEPTECPFKVGAEVIERIVLVYS
jgi:hypothetical protein